MVVIVALVALLFGCRLVKTPGPCTQIASVFV